MRFIALEVEDIFAYRGVSRVDFDSCTDTRNIVIVSGRNGAGKTSLLNILADRVSTKGNVKLSGNILFND